MGLFLFIGCCLAYVAGDAPADDAAGRRVEVHLFGGDMQDSAPLAAWYRSIGITDVWLYPLRGAFPQDQRPETQLTAQNAAGLVRAYRRHGIRSWWFERPVPDYLYETSKALLRENGNIWDDSPEAETIWTGIVRAIVEQYPNARAAGFTGLVYDNEAYYSYKGDEAGLTSPWVWAGHGEQCGPGGNYYRRGRQVGQAINAVWPGVAVIHVYAFGHEAERWWYQGFHDAGLDVRLGLEHTYGAGPNQPGEEWYQSWWQERTLVETCDWKREQFPFITNNQKFIAGLFPIEFRSGVPNYRAGWFAEQLRQAAKGDPNGPIAVWIWAQGPFTPESWQNVRYLGDDLLEVYMKALRRYSRAFQD